VHIAESVLVKSGRGGRSGRRSVLLSGAVSCDLPEHDFFRPVLPSDRTARALTLLPRRLRLLLGGLCDGFGPSRAKRAWARRLACR
jgi:hypothetical protein